MSKKTLLLACWTALLGLSGCALFQTGQPQNDVSYNDANENPCPQGYCETDPFVNYTQTRADFREYGELSPRDSVVSQSGAGNNISAVVPPSIENEVISYEEHIESAAAEAVPVATAPAATTAPAELVSASNVAAPAVVDSSVPAATTSTTAPTVPAAVVTPAAAVPASTAAAVIEQQISPVAETTVTDEKTEATASNAPEVTTAQNDEAVQDQAAATQGEQEDDDDEEDPVRDWYAEEGQNLKALLTEWSAESGWRLVWNTNRNYVLNAGAMFRGRFADVSSALIRAFARARPAPVATFYKGNRVLVVETMEDENAFD